MEYECNNLYCYKNGELLYRNVTMLYLIQKLRINKMKLKSHLNSKLYKSYYISFREMYTHEIKRIYDEGINTKKTRQISFSCCGRFFLNVFLYK